jgi:hypothetical protein
MGVLGFLLAGDRLKYCGVDPSLLFGSRYNVAQTAFS